MCRWQLNFNDGNGPENVIASSAKMKVIDWKDDSKRGTKIETKKIGKTYKIKGQFYENSNLNHNLTVSILNWNALLWFASWDRINFCHKHFADESGHISDIYYLDRWLWFVNINVQIEFKQWNFDKIRHHHRIVHRNKRLYIVLLARIKVHKLCQMVSFYRNLKCAWLCYKIAWNRAQLKSNLNHLFSSCVECSKSWTFSCNAIVVQYKFVHFEATHNEFDPIVWPFLWPLFIWLVIFHGISFSLIIFTLAHSTQ